MTSRYNKFQIISQEIFSLIKLELKFLYNYHFNDHTAATKNNYRNVMMKSKTGRIILNFNNMGKQIELITKTIPHYWVCLEACIPLCSNQNLVHR